MDKKDIRQFRQTINDSNYVFGKIGDSEDTLDWINSKLSDPNLYDQIKEKQSRLTIPDDMKQLIKQTEENRKKPFDKLKHRDKVLIKKLNRLMIELAHPHQAPRLRESIIPGSAQLKNLIKIDKKELVKEAIMKRLTAAADMLYSKKADKYIGFIDSEDFTKKILADFYAEFESNQSPDTKLKWYKILEQII